MDMLRYAEEESEIMDLKIARCNNMEQFPGTQLAAEVFKHRYDVLRIKISMKDSEIFDRFNKLGIPHNLFSFLIRKSTRTIGTIEYKKPDLKMVPYDVSKSEDLNFILNDLLLNSTGIYYTNAYYKHFIDDGKMLVAGIRHFIKMADGDKNAHFYLGYLNGECAGVCSFRLENNIAEGIFFGVSVKYRKRGLGHEFLTYAKQQCFELGAKEFYTDTLIQNPGSLYPQMNIGLIPKQTFVNVVFFPLMSKSPDAYREAHIVSNFDVFEKIRQWLVYMQMDNITLDEVKSLHYGQNAVFPIEVAMKLFRIGKDTVLISVIGLQHQFWVYVAGRVDYSE